MKNHKGSVPALLTLGLVLIGSLVTIGISFLTNNNKIASNPRAEIDAGYCCVKYKDGKNYGCPDKSAIQNVGKYCPNTEGYTTCGGYSSCDSLYVGGNIESSGTCVSYGAQELTSQGIMCVGGGVGGGGGGSCIYDDDKCDSKCDLGTCIKTGCNNGKYQCVTVTEFCTGAGKNCSYLVVGTDENQPLSYDKNNKYYSDADCKTLIEKNGTLIEAKQFCKDTIKPIIDTISCSEATGGNQKALKKNIFEKINQGVTTYHELTDVNCATPIDLDKICYEEVIPPANEAPCPFIQCNDIPEWTEINPGITFNVNDGIRKSSEDPTKFYKKDDIYCTSSTTTLVKACPIPEVNPASNIPPETNYYTQHNISNLDCDTNADHTVDTNNVENQSQISSFIRKCKSWHPKLPAQCLDIVGSDIGALHTDNYLHCCNNFIDETCPTNW